jgi:hypothetical protein
LSKQTYPALTQLLLLLLLLLLQLIRCTLMLPSTWMDTTAIP